MRWLWLLGSLWLFAGRAAALLAPPLPRLPIEESTDEHKFNADGSPDEELQLSLFNDKSEFSMKSEELDLLTDDITRKSGESREIPETTTVPTTTTTEEVEEIEESQEILEPIPPAERGPIEPLHHPGPPSIRPPVLAASAEETTTTEGPTTTTEAPSTTTTESTTTETTTASTTTASTTTTRQLVTEEPRVLIPVPGEEPEPELLTKEPEEPLQETFIFVPEATAPTVPPVVSTQDPLVLIPLPGGEETPPPPLPIIPDTVKETSFHASSEFTREGPTTTTEESPLDEEFFFVPQEPLVTIPLPEDVTIIPTIPNRRIIVHHRFRSTTTTAGPVANVFEPEKEEEVIGTTVPAKVEARITETELVDELVKSLPHVGTTVISVPVTVIPPRAQPTPSIPTSTRRTGDVTVAIKDSTRLLHRGQAKKFRRTGGRLRTRRPMKARPTTIRPKSLFRNSSDVVHHPHRVKTTPKKKIRRLRKKPLGESRFRISNEIRKV